MNLLRPLEELRTHLEGELYLDEVTRLIYSTDASAYREKPLAVVCPRHKEDLKKCVEFASEFRVPLIPRAGGTSLAGQVVGNGVVVDISRHMNRILELNTEERWVKVEPGVIPDELNAWLRPHGLFFAPETSTSNRCMIAGMLGNNACGAHSLVYGNTRDHTLEVEALLSDGSEAVFGALTPEAFQEKCEQDHLEGRIYYQLREMLSRPLNRKEIEACFPHPKIHRRNSGYALDSLIACQPFTPDGPPFNLSLLLAGSEGTLALTTAIKLNLVDLPPAEKGLLCVHLRKLEEAFMANLVALEHGPVAVELMDRAILELTRANIGQRKNRFFIEGDPGAVLIVEFASHTAEETEKKAGDLEKALREKGLGYHFPLITGAMMQRVWDLRKAGLGILSNMPGDARPVSVIEDTAVLPQDLPAYMKEFMEMLDRFALECVCHAHIGSGELHLRPVLNLKDPKDVETFRTLARESALLVKKYRGSLSGEHGDGRLRGEFIPLVMGDHVCSLFKEIKQVWDPDGIFNPGKITGTPPMNTFLRYTPGEEIPEYPTVFDFSDTGGLVRAAEKCNGSGDCRKTEKTGGLMCPSYMATRDEHASTRARANLLREMLTSPGVKNPFASREVYEILDLCLSCKGCKSECPSSVDMARLKAEFLQHYYDAHGIPLRTRLIAYIAHIQKLGSVFPALFNFFATRRFFANALKKMLGFARERSIPVLHQNTLRKWIRQHPEILEPVGENKGEVVLFADEFTNFLDTPVGITAIRLLHALGYRVMIPTCAESGRSYISKGLLRTARKRVQKNIRIFAPLVSHTRPMVGIEPSAILGFRDEYPGLAGDELKEEARRLAEHALMIDEFLVREYEAGKIDSSLFTDRPKKISLHGHCQQKAVASTESTRRMLEIPANYRVEEIPSGCCGMAGSFGYEKEHYELSMKVGELALFPALRELDETVEVAAPGTSCRCQIKDGTGKKARHPVEILWDALEKKAEPLTEKQEPSISTE
ncbi:MAG TPA: FAD-binding oxidoreductase [Bacteroidetes bacterium]|nr:FAD-binding oxidoreductase [Bacteroidota bacterium]